MRYFLACCFLLALAPAAQAQSSVLLNYRNSTLGTTEVSPANPLPVVLDAGSSSPTKSVCVTPTVTTSNSYGTNYVVGGLLTFTSAFNATGTGTLQSVIVTIHEVETSGFTFFPFNANPSSTTWTDASVAAINTADIPKTRTPVALGANAQLASSGFTVAGATGLGEAMVSGGTTVYGVLLANAALTTQFAAATDVQVCITTYADP